MNHLEDAVSAFVDGQLAPSEMEDAALHVLGCSRCAEEVAVVRQSRRLLEGGDEPTLDPALTMRLLDFAAHPPPVSHRIGRGALAATACSLALFMIGFTLLGTVAEHRVDPRTLYTDATVDVTDGATVRTASWTAVAATGLDEAAEEGWPLPRTLPAGLRLSRVELVDAGDGRTLEVDLASADGSVHLVAQRGRLDLEGQPLTATRIGGRDVWVLDGADRVAVVQCDEYVVVVWASPTAHSRADDLIETLPAEDFDTSLPGRLVRGVETAVSLRSP